MPRKKKRSRRVNEPVYYVIEIDGWDWSYSFGVNNTGHFDDPYLEFRHLQVLGRLIQPKGIKAKRATPTLMPDKRLNEENRQNNKPTAVGSLTLNRGTLEGLLPIPADALGPVLQVLIADRARYAVLDSTKLRYRSAMVQSFRIDMTYDEDDLPPENE